MTRPGRPLGEIAGRVLQWSRDTGLDVTSLDVARALQMPHSLASKTLSNLRAAGHMREVGEIFQAGGGSKPVKVCEPVSRGAPPQPVGEAALPSIMVLDWPR